MYLSHRKVVFILLFFSLLIASVVTAQNQIPNHNEYAFVVKFSSDFIRSIDRDPDGSLRFPTGYKELDELIQSSGNSKLSPIFTFDPISLKNPSFWELGMDRFYLVNGTIRRDKPFGNRTLDQAIEYASQLKQVEVAEYSRIYHADLTPNDWNAAASTYGMWGLDEMRCREAWDISTGSNQVLIVTIDTGVNYDHPDLINAILVNASEDINHDGRFTSADLDGVDNDGNGFIDDVIGYDFVSINPSNYSHCTAISGEDYGPRDPTPSDFNGHGTHVAGTVAAVSDNGIGVPSAAFSARTICVRVASEFVNNGSTNSWFFDTDVSPGLQYAVNRGARIISCSFGALNSSGSTLEHTAFQFARNNNCLVFAAAGNDGVNQLHYPSADPLVQAVASLTTNHKRSSFSNFADWVDFCAPGSNIYSTYRTGGYMYMSGTSMASPNAASVAGLLLSRNLSMTDDELLTLMQNYCTNPDPFNPPVAGQPNCVGLMGKMVDAYALFRNALPLTITSPIESDTINVGNSIRFRWQNSTAVSNVRVDISRDYPYSEWETIIGSTSAAQGYADWVTTGGDSPNIRFRILNTANLAQGDTTTRNTVFFTYPAPPIHEGFDSETFPPTGWTLHTSSYMQTWQRYTGTNGNDGCAVIDDQARRTGRTHAFQTPPYRTSGLRSATMELSYSCMVDTFAMDNQDSLFLEYGFTPTGTFYPFASKWSNGTGDQSLLTENGAMNAPGATWGRFYAAIPQAALNRNTIYFRIRIYSAYPVMMDNTDLPDFFIDDIRLATGPCMLGPSNGTAIQTGPSTVEYSWIDNSNNESRFDVFKSTDGVAFEPITSVGANVTSYTFTNLVPNTRYWFKTLASDGFEFAPGEAFADLILPTMVPYQPTIGLVSQYGFTLLPENNLTYPNSVETEYAIRINTTSSTNWVQADHSLGTDPVWLTLTQWGQFFVENLSPNTSYWVATMARSMQGFPTEMSAETGVLTLFSTDIPLWETFTDHYWHPYLWQVQNDDNWRSWQRYSDENGNDGVGHITLSSYYADGARDILWSPYLDLRFTPGAHVTFVWSYAGSGGLGNDSLVVLANQIDTGVENPIWTADAYSASGTSLVSGTGGSSTTPATDGTWNRADVVIPQMYVGIQQVRIGFMGVNHVGADIFIDSIYINNVSIPPPPTGAVATADSPVSMLVAWNPVSEGQTGYLIEFSSDGSTFSPIDTVGAADTSTIIYDLWPNTYYYFRVYSLYDYIRSSGYSEAGRYTLPEIQPQPIITALGCNMLRIHPQIGGWTNTNTYLTIRETSTGLWVNPSGGELFAGEVGAPYWQWDTVTVTGLTAGTSYYFETYAYNPDWIRSLSSIPAVASTYSVGSLPITETFSSETFPPDRMGSGKSRSGSDLGSREWRQRR